MTNIPKTAKRIPIRPLALGEATGHHHSLTSHGTLVTESSEVVEMYEDTDGTVYVKIKDEQAVAALQHQEHYGHALPAIEYERRQQVEVTDWGQAPVRD